MKSAELIYYNENALLKILKLLLLKKPQLITLPSILLLQQSLSRITCGASIKQVSRVSIKEKKYKERQKIKYKHYWINIVHDKFKFFETQMFYLL